MLKTSTATIARPAKKAVRPIGELWFLHEEFTEKEPYLDEEAFVGRIREYMEDFNSVANLVVFCDPNLPDLKTKIRCMVYGRVAATIPVYPLSEPSDRPVPEAVPINELSAARKLELFDSILEYALGCAGCDDYEAAEEMGFTEDEIENYLCLASVDGEDWLDNEEDENYDE